MRGAGGDGHQSVWGKVYPGRGGKATAATHGAGGDGHGEPSAQKSGWRREENAQKGLF